MKGIYKVQFSGGNIKRGKPKQAYIAIPMQWVKNHGIKKGTELTINWDLHSPELTVRCETHGNERNTENALRR